MLLGPIFTIEVLTSARRARMFLLRALFAGVLFLVLWSSYSTSFSWSQQVTIASAAQFALTFFNGLTFVQITAMLLLAPAAVGSLVARERECRTIEYLFATDLSNAEIVLGKLSAGLLNLTGLLLVGLPVLSLAMLFGGISPERLVATYIVAASTMVAVACLSLAVSIWSPRSRDAVIQSYAVMALLFFGPYFLEDLFVYLPGSEWWRWGGEQLTACNPYGFQFALLPGLLTGGIVGIWQALEELLRNQAILAVASLGVAVAGIRRAHVRSLGTQARRGRWRLPRVRLRPALGNRAILWKELFAERATGKLATVVRLVVGGLLLLFAWSGVASFFKALQSQSYAEQHAFFVVMAGTAVVLGALILIGVRASQSVATERERDTWIALLSTPLLPSEIVFAKLSGSLYMAVIPMLLLLVTWGLTCMVYPMFVFAVPFAMATTVVLALASAAVGLFFSFWCRTSTRALLATLSTLLLGFGAYYVLCPCLMMPVMWANDESRSTLFLTALLTPLVPYLAGYPVAVGIWGARETSEFALHFAYLTGNVFYGTLTIVAVTYCIQRFDRMAGRTTAAGPDGLGRALRRAAGRVGDGASSSPDSE